MAKSSAKPLPRWMSAKRDCREARFVQIGNSLLFHEKFRSLSAGAFKLYICCAMEAAGSINFQIPASKAEQYGIPRQSFVRYMKELEEAGFIQKERSGKSTRTASDYSFSFRWLELLLHLKNRWYSSCSKAWRSRIF